MIAQSGTALRALALVALAASLVAAPARASSVPTFDEVRAAWRPSDATLTDRRGVPIAERRIDRSTRRLAWVALDQISPATLAALVAGEDRRFHEHAGVDWAGLAVAAWDSARRVVRGQRVRGGSTLTMQLASMLDPALRPAGRDPRTLAQKWDQASAAIAIERTWTKPQILEAYLNLVSYRGELVGLAAAARGLFGKAPSGLDADESAILVALLRAPGAPAAEVAPRACAVAAAAAGAAIGASECETIRVKASIAFAGGHRAPGRAGVAPHVAARLLSRPGERVASTIDAALQRDATEALAAHLAALRERGVEDAALVVLDNASGDVLAWVGSSGSLSAAPEVDGVVARRQAGSTLKPFLYALAIDARLLTAASIVDDSPLAIATGRGVYAPQNYDHGWRGAVSVRTALAASLNIPAVRTLELVGGARFLDALHDLGLGTLDESDEHYGAALALGAADVALLDLANAYRAIANGGLVTPVRLRTDAPVATGRRVLGAPAAAIVADILADRGARATTFGLESPLAARVWSFAKTGTSKDMRDNWCVGATSRYTVGVWVGNFSGAPMKDVSGVTGAAPLWRDLVHRLHRDEPSVPSPPPAGVERVRIAFDPPIEPSRDELFLPGTATATVRAVARAGADEGAAPTPSIRYPVDGAILAIDPDLPRWRQRVTLVASPAHGDLRWFVGGTELAQRGGRVDWTPEPGRHPVTLVDAGGVRLGAIVVEVR